MSRQWIQLINKIIACGLLGTAVFFGADAYGEHTSEKWVSHLSTKIALSSFVTGLVFVVVSSDER